MWNLLNKYGYHGVLRIGENGVGAPSLAGAPAPGGQPGQQPPLGGSPSDPGYMFDNDAEEGLDPDLEEILDAFTPDQQEDPFEVNDVGLQPFRPAPIPQEQVDSMNADVKASIKAMKFPSAAIPADFDPNNREHIQGLMDTAMRAAATQIMGVVFKPVSLSLGHTIKQLESSMDSKLQIATQSNGARNVITDMVPEYNMPEYSGLVRSMDEQLRKLGKKPQERAVTLRKTLNTMGITGNKKGGKRGAPAESNDVNAPQGTIRQGKTVLDAFFPVNLS